MDINVQFDDVYKKIDDNAIERGQREFANEAMSDMEPYVPKLDGFLRNTGTIDLDGTGINYNEPYSAYQFYNQFQNYTTPGTGPRWDKKAEGNHMRNWERAFMKGAGW